MAAVGQPSAIFSSAGGEQLAVCKTKTRSSSRSSACLGNRGAENRAGGGGPHSTQLTITGRWESPCSVYYTPRRPHGARSDPRQPQLGPGSAPARLRLPASSNRHRRWEISAAPRRSASGTAVRPLRLGADGGALPPEAEVARGRGAGSRRLPTPAAGSVGSDGRRSVRDVT